MLSALAFLSIVGGGKGRPPDERTLRWFAPAGAVIGAAIAASHWAAHRWWPALVAGAVVVVVDLVLTGGLHLDGLADSADGLLPPVASERRLAIMAEPTVGAFAVVAVGAAVVLRSATMAIPDVAPLSIVAVWAAARGVAAVVPALLPYARDAGLASAFLDGASRWLALWLVVAGAVLVAVAGWRGGVAIGALIVAWAGVLVIARRRIGGFTGDVLGAGIVLGETAALLALVSKL